MTMTEEKKLRFQIARLESTRVSNVFIDKVEELGENKRIVQATVKYYKIGVRMHGDNVTESWWVI